jgi:cell fate (sporulation/competence/biofilm development) regulator YlbF (YheA/YmcA/DUF963 family)
LQTLVKRDIWTIARQLSEALEETPELQEYRRTEDAVLADDAAIDLIREYENKKRTVKRSKGKTPQEQMEAVTDFMEVESRFEAHEVIQAYWAAREKIDALLDRLNAVITFPITGSEAPKQKGGCGSSGGGCGCS